MSTLVYVGFWKRVAAVFLDCIFMIPVMVLNYYLQLYSFNNRVIWPGIISTSLWYLFYIYFVSKYGGSPGKLILKLKIVNSKLTNIDSIKTAIRYLIIMSPSIASLFCDSFVYKTMPPDIKASNYLSIGKLVQQYSGPYQHLAMIFAIFVWIDILVLLFNKKKRALHDFLAGSFVVDKNSLPIE